MVLDGFDVPAENYHNFANGLRWGPDGWLYGRCGARPRARSAAPGTPLERHPAGRRASGAIIRRRKVFEPLAHGTTNPWGHDWDAQGEGFFINTVNGHLWHLIPGAHYRPPAHDRPEPAGL